jgi:hypothetical protein
MKLRGRLSVLVRLLVYLNVWRTMSGGGANLSGIIRISPALLSA